MACGNHSKCQEAAEKPEFTVLVCSAKESKD
ncbi:hypothetical protein CIB84_000746 [Bambusicola thoracicus]|uniref:Uncharacterized protein n=1 Tax=Bambusicola thoracicus TaxID=9083 RepID=A0A2P4TGM1_BAMTH|nr:hypothetical protein CIB84_000746 [Bambusicola thoracicus]